MQRAIRSGSGQNLVSESEQQILGTATEVTFLIAKKVTKEGDKERRCRLRLSFLLPARDGLSRRKAALSLTSPGSLRVVVTAL